MNILHVSTLDISGGGARAAYRLHHSLLNAGFNSSMLVQFKSSDESLINSFADKPYTKIKSTILPFLDKLPLRKYENRNRDIFWTNGHWDSGAVNYLNRIKPDIVNLHWIGGGFVSVKEIARINCPLVWTFHDFWAFTGGCHYPVANCLKYITGCSNCPALSSDKINDLSRKGWQQKYKYWNDINLSVVAPSRWLAERAKESGLMKKYPIYTIPNTIDTTVFKPINKQVARDILNIDLAKKVIAFGSVKPTEDDRKGFNLLRNSIKCMYDRNELQDVELVIFGASKPIHPIEFAFPSRFMGKITDDTMLALIYSAADVMVVPSKQENLSNSIMESLACGTPVVAFDIGGNSDMIKHGYNGYLAAPFDESDIACGIEWLLNTESIESLSAHARKTVIDNYSEQIISQKYGHLYQKISQCST